MRLLHFNVKKINNEYQAMCFEFRDILVVALTLDELILATMAELDVKHNEKIDVQFFYTIKHEIKNGS